MPLAALLNFCTALAQQPANANEKQLVLKDNQRLMDQCKPVLKLPAPVNGSSGYIPPAFGNNISMSVSNNFSSSFPVCKDTSFKKELDALNRAYEYVCSDKTSDGGIVIAGFGFDKSISNPKYYAEVSKFDNQGNLLWSREVQSYVHSYMGVNRVKELSDGSIVITGTHENQLNWVTPDYNEMFMAKLTAAGDLSWLKTYRNLIVLNCTATNLIYGNITECAGGDLVVTATAMNCPLPKALVVFKVNNSGILQWKYGFIPVSHDAMGLGAYYEGNTITVICRGDDNGSSAGGAIHTDLIKLDYTTGTLISYKGWKVDLPFPDNFYHSFTNEATTTRLDNGNYCVFGVAFGAFNFTAGDTTAHFLVQEFNSNFDFVSGYVIKTPLLSNYNRERIKVNSAKKALFAISKDITFPDLDIYTGYISNDRIEYQRKSEYRGVQVGYLNFEASNDGSEVLLNTFSTIGPNDYKIEYAKLHNSDTASSCMGSKIPICFIQPINCVPHNFNWETITASPFNETANQNNSSVPMVHTSSASCIQASLCDTLKIHGQGVVCNYQQDLVFTAYRNKTCGSFVNWDINQSVVQEFSVLNDSTVKIRLNQPWQGWLNASFNSSCGQFSDAIFIDAGSGPSQVNLGPDVQICEGNSVQLTADSGYTSYLWNTGSTSSNITVSVPGIYYVDVLDGCAVHSSDTIVVSLAPPSPISIGADRTKCNSDTIQLMATGGFLNYSWGPNYNISALNTQMVVVQPAVDTIYYVKAEKTPGCFAFDTVKVYVNNSVPVHLGADVSFCQGDSRILNAGAGFSQYIWNTGATTEHITVYTAGIYSVTGVAPNGCKSYDTLQVLNVWPLPSVTLTKDTVLCTGQSKTYSPGLFQSYLWQDGSLNSTFTATGTGVYFVTVTDNNGCKGSDTASIKIIAANPSGFLMADTTVCNSSPIQIKTSNSFRDYLWSTGATAPSILVYQPGIFYLDVTDNNNCKGRDTINVLAKDCFKGFFVPNAFTPNGDNKNDVLKPLVFGNLSQYRFTIYNRYGEIVFSTLSPATGWDGTVQGKPQDPGAYTWKCTYQIEQRLVTTDQGSFLLIR